MCFSTAFETTLPTLAIVLDESCVNFKTHSNQYYGAISTEDFAMMAVALDQSNEHFDFVQVAYSPTCSQDKKDKIKSLISHIVSKVGGIHSDDSARLTTHVELDDNGEAFKSICDMDDDFNYIRMIYDQATDEVVEIADELDLSVLVQSTS